LNELPVLEEKVLNGSMNLSTMCQANRFFRKEAKTASKDQRPKNCFDVKRFYWPVAFAVLSATGNQ